MELVSNRQYHIFPLGDSALTIDFGNIIDEGINKEVMNRFQQLNDEPLSGVLELVPAYSSLTIHFDMPGLHKKIQAQTSVFDWLKEQLEELLKKPVPSAGQQQRTITIPVCYETPFAPDLAKLALAKNLTEEEVIRIHTSKTYRVYMLGFIPGFSYLGEVDERIMMPRKQQPQPVQAGSVGIAGRQTGIYPLTSPGGWQIIGRTPLKLFDADKQEPVLLKAGDIVQFISITKNEFANH